MLTRNAKRNGRLVIHVPRAYAAFLMTGVDSFLQMQTRGQPQRKQTHTGQNTTWDKLGFEPLPSGLDVYQLQNHVMKTFILSLDAQAVAQLTV